MSTCSTVCEFRFVSASGTSWLLLGELGDVHGDDEDDEVVEAGATDADSNNVSPSRCRMASTMVSKFCLEVLVRYTLRTNATRTKWHTSAMRQRKGVSFRERVGWQKQTIVRRRMGGHSGVGDGVTGGYIPRAEISPLPHRK